VEEKKMLYFKVKPEYDNAPMCYVDDDTGYLLHHDVLVADELYTPNELSHFRNVSLECFELVDVKEEDIYFFFGSRFESRNPCNR
jgi:hypothetical protein